MKRIFDLVFSAVMLFVLSPIFLLVAVLILLLDGSPVFFKQTRVGKNRKKFNLYKFRTMKTLKSAEKGSFDAGSSARVTAIGKILRKTKLDELPQLLNVLKGDMSVVGPRPEVEKCTLYYQERWDTVLTVKPGLTDFAAIEFRNEEELLSQQEEPEHYYHFNILPAKLDMYEKYVEQQSIILDLKLIFKTVLAIVK